MPSGLALAHGISRAGGCFGGGGGGFKGSSWRGVFKPKVPQALKEEEQSPVPPWKASALLYSLASAVKVHPFGSVVLVLSANSSITSSWNAVSGGTLMVTWASPEAIEVGER